MKASYKTIQQQVELSSNLDLRTIIYLNRFVDYSLSEKADLIQLILASLRPKSY